MMNEIAVQQIKRNFIVGDEWLYLKIYTGYKSSEMILREAIYPVVMNLLNNGTIDKWFFIRYSDPKYHIRIRFHFTRQDAILDTIVQFNEAVRYFVDKEIVWKVQADTYQREIERYGVKTMELSENLFFVDSMTILNALNMLYGQEDEQTRWLLSMKMIDQLLNDFGLDMEQRLEQLERMYESFGREFNVETYGRQQLSLKYRSHKQAIETAMGEEGLSDFNTLFEMKTSNQQDIIKCILQIRDENELDIPLSELFSSYIHMTMNRLFRTNQRKHELVIYCFLTTYYKSQLARQKYNKKPSEA